MNFFSHDKEFYRTYFTIFLTLSLQRIVAYSVNMADNIMLGSYSQEALGGAACVNQIFFMVQFLGAGIGDAVVIIGSQYWGEKRPGPICRIGGCGLKLSVFCGALVCALCFFIPSGLVSVFTPDAAYISEGVKYLDIIKYSFFLYLVSNTLISLLRSVGTVRISFYISVVSLFVNVGINYVLIFGKFGLPEMGIAGAAIGTVTARALELVIVAVYLLKVDKKLSFFKSSPLKKDAATSKAYRKVSAQMIFSNCAWAISVPMQTAILGRLSSDALAANSVSSTFYQYLKVVAQAQTSAIGVVIGTAVGEGDREKVKEKGRTLSVLSVVTGTALGLLLFALRIPLLSMYGALTASTRDLADQMIILMCFVMVGMSYQVAVNSGIIGGGGDTRFNMVLNVVCTWCIVMPLSFMSAFWWKWPVIWVVLVIQSDQIFKGLPAFIRFRSYKWIKKLTS